MCVYEHTYTLNICIRHLTAKVLWVQNCFLVVSLKLVFTKLMH